MSTSFEAPLMAIPGLQAAGDLSANQFLFHKINSSAQATICTVQGELTVGVLQNKPTAAGQAATVMAYGVTKVIAGGTIAAGAQVETDANGKAIAIVKGTTSGSNVVAGAVAGIALSGASSGQYLALLLTPGGATAATTAA